jgi:hypothetical protein
MSCSEMQTLYSRHGVIIRDSEWQAGMILSYTFTYYLQTYETSVNYARALGTEL